MPDEEVDHTKHGERDEDDDPSTSNASEAAGGASKKKKKKQKKKSDSGGSDSSSSHDAASSKPKLDKGEAEKRFVAALDAARKGDLWIDLSSSSIQQGKTKKLFDALKSNDSVTSINLSDNQINDDGAQAIAAVLGTNCAPALIDLDLRDNPVTEVGLKVLEGLAKIRKKLIVKTGSVHDPDLEAAPKVSKEIKEFTKGKMFKKFFQTEDDDDEPSLSHQESQLDDRGINPEELWDAIKEVQKMGELSQLTLKLQQLCLLLPRETQALQSQHSDVLDGSKPHIKECVANLAVLRACLDIAPRRITMQYSSEPQPAVGTHRVLVAEIVAQLLSPNNVSLDTAVADAKLVPALLHLGIAHPLCSSLHTKALRIFKSCQSSDVADLHMSMMVQPGWGCGLQDPLLVAQEPAQLCRPLPELLAATATPMIGMPSGMRSTVAGFVLELSKVLQETCESSADRRGNQDVARALQVSSAWSDFSGSSTDAGSHGALHQLLQEQSDELCGPRPVRPVTEEENPDLAELAGGGLMSGREILALLQGMSAMGVIS